MIGQLVSVQTVDGKMYEGIYSSYDTNSNEHFLKQVKRVEKNNKEEFINPIDTLQISFCDVSQIQVKDIIFASQNLEFRTKEFMTDSQISELQNGVGKKKKRLVKWKPEDGSDPQEYTELESEDFVKGSWDMYKGNEKFGVTSTYKDGEYNVKIDWDKVTKSDLDKANETADNIIHDERDADNVHVRDARNLKVDMSEEDMYSSVSRGEKGHVKKNVKQENKKEDDKNPETETESPKPKEEEESEEDKKKKKAQNFHKKGMLLKQYLMKKINLGEGGQKVKGGRNRALSTPYVFATRKNKSYIEIRKFMVRHPSKKHIRRRLKKSYSSRIIGMGLDPGSPKTPKTVQQDFRKFVLQKGKKQREKRERGKEILALKSFLKNVDFDSENLKKIKAQKEREKKRRNSKNKIIRHPVLKSTTQKEKAKKKQKFELNINAISFQPTGFVPKKVGQKGGPTRKGYHQRKKRGFPINYRVEDKTVRAIYNDGIVQKRRGKDGKNYKKRERRRNWGSYKVSHEKIPTNVKVGRVLQNQGGYQSNFVQGGNVPHQHQQNYNQPPPNFNPNFNPNFQQNMNVAPPPMNYQQMPSQPQFIPPQYVQYPQHQQQQQYQRQQQQIYQQQQQQIYQNQMQYQNQQPQQVYQNQVPQQHQPQHYNQNYQVYQRK